MNTIDICSKLEDATYLVNSFTGQEPMHPETSMGTGSGVAINENGDILTAAHVVTGRLPVREQDLNDPNVIILARKKGEQFIQYYPVICGPAIDNETVKQPLTIDLALLRSITRRKNIPYLRISSISIKVGTQVLMAGFPDDMGLPFEIDQSLDRGNPEGQSFFPCLQFAKHQLLMIKSRMIGHRTRFVQTDGKLTLEGEVFYVDNQIHSGASGGPVVNRDGKVVGIITQRAITSVASKDYPDLKVPSGSTVAISPRVIQPLIDQANSTR